MQYEGLQPHTNARRRRPQGAPIRVTLARLSSDSRTLRCVHDGYLRNVWASSGLESIYKISIRLCPCLMTHAPQSQRGEDRLQIFAFRCKRVLVSRWIVLVRHALDEASILQALQAVREHIGWNPLCGLEKFPVPPLTPKQIAHDQQGPAITQDI